MTELHGRSMFTGALLALACLLLGVFLGQRLLPDWFRAKASEVQQISQGLTILDAQGRPRIVLGKLDGDDYGLRAFSAAGVQRLNCVAPGDAYATARLGVCDFGGEELMTMQCAGGLHHGPEPSLDIKASPDELLIQLGMGRSFSEGGARLAMFDESGDESVTLSTGFLGRAPHIVLRSSVADETTAYDPKSASGYGSLHLSAPTRPDMPGMKSPVLRAGVPSASLLVEFPPDANPRLLIQGKDDALLFSTERP